MTIARLAESLGSAPMPTGGWEREAVLTAPAPDPGAADRLRALPGVAAVRPGPGRLLKIVVAEPGEIVTEIGPCFTAFRAAWPDLPRTWDNPGFVVRYAHARAVAVARWARDLGVPVDGFAPGELSGPWDRAVLRVLAELPSRCERAEPGWAAYLERLALAYHDAHERAPAVPVGDEPARPVHTARLRMAGAVRLVISEGLTANGRTAPDRL
ncbi:DALR anticodon-binding domain-containing protein [Spongiactinospora sp. TRM90649]|uniref:DALR anticodon-binding domain-containing protein n=1 Tax=Spongiactinospora sp. TRM90649 TaxID=3031114 RepID=UPI0023F78F7C|nr:DALR anticodon-binding domain-containing protein [Spongiactinospora sp. TRM90649]MDF5752524.1 DALR anticodon-binding domain-containing protein [Spongiactinospora sp. TRM90649]